MSNKTKNKKEK